MAGARCSDDVSAAPMGELHGNGSHGTRRPEDQHALAACEPSVVEQALPGGEPGQDHGRGAHVIDGPRLGRHLPPAQT